MRTRAGFLAYVYELERRFLYLRKACPVPFPCALKLLLQDRCHWCHWWRVRRFLLPKAVRATEWCSGKPTSCTTSIITTSSPLFLFHSTIFVIHDVVDHGSCHKTSRAFRLVMVRHVLDVPTAYIMYVAHVKGSSPSHFGKGALEAPNLVIWTLTSS